MSSGVTISVDVKPYILQWIKHHYGIPARFPKKSYTNLLIGELIAKPPRGYVPGSDSGNLSVELPFYVGKDVRCYNYLSSNSRKALTENLRQQFYFSMFEEVEYNKSRLQTTIGVAIRMFMEKYDIDEAHFETLKKKEYRKRRTEKRVKEKD
jgi:hypothetical protein